MKYKDFYSNLFESVGTSSVDETYLRLSSDPKNNAVELQKLVLDYAKRKGYAISASHSTNSKPFTIFKTSNLSAHFGSEKAALDRASILKDFSVNVVKRSHEEARVMNVLLKVESPLEMPDLASLYQNDRGEFITLDRDDEDDLENEDEATDRKYPSSWESETDFQEWLLSNDVIESDDFWDVQYDKDKTVEVLQRDGFDGISYENVVEDSGSISYIIFSPNQVKLSNLITYDNEGKIIPLSKRFDSSNDDIRY
jgi:hypothetical protein